METHAPSSPKEFHPPFRHPSLYLDDGNVVFLVEGTLFKFHRHFLIKHSPVFRDMFSLPPLPAPHLEGASDEHPIVLADVSSASFEHFLEVFYPKNIVATPTSPELLSILECSRRWACDTLYAWAVAQVAALDEPITHVRVGRRFAEGALLRKGFDGFAARREFLSADEVACLAGPEIANLARYREEMRAAGFHNAQHLHLTELQKRKITTIYDACCAFYTAD